MKEEAEIFKQCAEVYRRMEAEKEAAKMKIPIEEYLKLIGEVPVKRERVKLL